jgi:hypothetical protein
VRRNATHICDNLVNKASCVGMVPPMVLLERRLCERDPPPASEPRCWELGEGPGVVALTAPSTPSAPRAA